MSKGTFKRERGALDVINADIEAHDKPLGAPDTKPSRPTSCIRCSKTSSERRRPERPAESRALARLHPDHVARLRVPEHPQEVRSQQRAAREFAQRAVTSPASSRTSLSGLSQSSSKAIAGRKRAFRPRSKPSATAAKYSAHARRLVFHDVQHATADDRRRQPVVRLSQREPLKCELSLYRSVVAREHVPDVVRLAHADREVTHRLLDLEAGENSGESLLSCMCFA